jgi:hypothetical protein
MSKMRTFCLGDEVCEKLDECYDETEIRGDLVVERALYKLFDGEAYPGEALGISGDYLEHHR